MFGKARRHSADAGNSLSDTDLIIKSVDDETDRECSTHRRGKYAYKVLVEKRGGRRPPGRPRRRWEGNYKIRPNEIGREVD